MRGSPSILSLFATSLIYSIIMTGAQMLDYIYHMTLKLLKIAFWA